MTLKVIGGFKMKFKKVICLTTAIMVSALSLVGCGSNEKKADDKLKVTMMQKK